ncbi:hypothetical protein GUJ93_ZPchr0006g43098 [Zizania palustris]|uniref:Uncharacterized protein n=1 Tax=Zizania palustris TaxID=103762 RepID=A0A8J5STX6_ZIZPA|nr:hypothetical protein GUJ93_ZPchr0006g43098 [Zizania palustris]
MRFSLINLIAREAQKFPAHQILEILRAYLLPVLFVLPLYSHGFLPIISGGPVCSYNNCGILRRRDSTHGLPTACPELHTALNVIDDC